MHPSSLPVNEQNDLQVLHVFYVLASEQALEHQLLPAAPDLKVFTATYRTPTI
jgi:hypothetical protein